MAATEHVSYGRIVCAADCTCGLRDDPNYAGYPRKEERYSRVKAMDRKLGHRPLRVSRDGRMPVAASESKNTPSLNEN